MPPGSRASFLGTSDGHPFIRVGRSRCIYGALYRSLLDVMAIRDTIYSEEKSKKRILIQTKNMVQVIVRNIPKATVISGQLSDR